MFIYPAFIWVIILKEILEVGIVQFSVRSEQYAVHLLITGYFTLFT